MSGEIDFNGPNSVFTCVDTFGRPNASVIGDPQRDYVGTGWQQLPGFINPTSFGIFSGGAGQTGTSVGQIPQGLQGIVLTVPSANCVITFTFGTLVAPEVGILFRCLSCQNGYLCGVLDNGRWGIWQSVGAAFTQAFTTGILVATGDAVRLELSGNSVAMQVNGSAPQTFTDTQFQSGRFVGIGASGGLGNNGFPIARNFQVT